MTDRIYTQDRNLAPPMEFASTADWLAALPPGTAMVHEHADGTLVGLWTVEDVIAAQNLAPLIRRLLEGAA